MAASKTPVVIIAAGTSRAAGAADTLGTAVDLTTKDGAVITGLITNGGTGPSVQAVAYVEISIDNTNWKQLAMYPGGITAGVSTPFTCNIAAPIMYVRVRVAGNTGQAVTCESFAHVLNNF